MRKIFAQQIVTSELVSASPCSLTLQSLPLFLLLTNQSLNKNAQKSLPSKPLPLTKSITFSSSVINCSSIGFQDLAELAHNKALVAATASAAIGQLLKPLSSSFLYGRDLDFKALVRSGGFPSTHSAAVVAAATSLGLERGFSDSVFGMSVVFASIVMYDAQGVRREAGKHAKVLNLILQLKTEENLNSSGNNENAKNSSSSINSESRTPVLLVSRKAEEPPISILEERNHSPFHFTSENNCKTRTSLMHPSIAENQNCDNLFPLEESVGHTEVQVIAGAVLGFLISLAVNSVL
ncbi:hypothetical protein Sjap_026498 [Stephania japonica]|uniref:Acid phosphatase/vanadium-dependent haloperoxidase-related protein n=1 Tax=Stephania japonica TaxID=461633 RepID=A0AAP0E852_9MAGN